MATGTHDGARLTMKEPVCADLMVPSCRIRSFRRSRSIVSGMLIVFALCSSAFRAHAAPQREQRDALMKEVARLNQRAYDVRADSMEASIRYARQALRIARSIQDSAGISLAYVRIGMAYKRTARMDSAAWMAQQALGIAQRGAFRKTFMAAAMLLAEIHKDQGELDESLALVRMGLEISRLERDKEQEARFQNAIGLVLLKMGDPRAAMDALFKGLEIRKTLDNTKELMESRLNIANLYFDMEQPKLAKAAFAEYLLTARLSGSRSALAKGMLNYGTALLVHEDHDEAIAYLDSARVLFTELKDDRNLAKALQNLADAARSMDRMDEAFAYANQAAAAFERSGSLEGASASFRTLARLSYEKGDIHKARELAQQALAKAQQGKLLKAEASSRELLAGFHRDLKEYDEAIRQYKAFIALKDSMINDQSVAELAASEMRERYNAERSLTEIQDLRMQNAQRAAQTERQRLLRNVFIGSAAVLLVLSVVLLRNLQHRKRLARQERTLYEQRMNDLMRQQEIRSLDAMMEGQERERDRIAKDLHDRLGSMLSAIKLQFSALDDRIERLRSEQKERYDHVFTLLDDAVGEVRRISHDMVRGSLAQFGLKGALEDLRSALTVPGKLEVELSIFGLEERIDRKLEIAAYRMVQECISNALKHAQANAITIQVTRSAGLLNIMVEDNGVGFDPAKATEGMGMGNLRHRAAEVNGAVRVDAHPGRGTSVSIDIPLA